MSTAAAKRSSRPPRSSSPSISPPNASASTEKQPQISHLPTPTVQTTDSASMTANKTLQALLEEHGDKEEFCSNAALPEH